MHILLIHQAFTALDEAGGTRHHELARFLVSRGHQVTIIASPVSYLTGKIIQTEDQTSEEGITILRAYTYSALHRSFVDRVISFMSFMLSSFFIGLRVRKIDLVWGTSPPIFQGVTALVLARLKGVPFLFEVRDLWPAFAIAVGVLRNPILIKASLLLECFLYRNADRVMVNSPGYIEHVALRGAKKVELIPNGADPGMFAPQATGLRFRKQLGLDEEFIVLYAGAHGLSNDLGVVLQAADQLRAHSEIRFVFIGDGKDKPALQARSQTMDLPNVLFAPAASKSEMADVMAAADACVAILLPIELYKTTYPNKVFDYMAAGRPVILAIDGVIRQVVESAGAGIFVPPGNPSAMAEAVLALSSDHLKARAMGLAGRQYIEQFFSRHELAERLYLLLEEMRENG
jgi:glycosyltransferase involved in cell wall biosynthesis